METNTEIYFDNNATTPIAPEVFDAMIPYLKNHFGNPSSLHQKGVIAERAIKDARRQLAHLLKTQEHEIIFTSGGTESNNLAIKGIAHAAQKKGKHIITTATEHEAVLECCKQLQKEGFEITIIKTDVSGKIAAETICNHIKNETILVAIMHVNNELGTLNDIHHIAKAIKNIDSRVMVFSDGAQAFGKTEINLQHVDAYSFSGHKIHAPKGIGGLFLKERTTLHALISGGGQEFKQRSGTENVAGIVALAEAASLAYHHLPIVKNQFQQLKSRLIEGLQKISSAIINSPADSLEHVVNVSFLGIPSEVMMHSLEQKGIYVSAGSACSGSKREPSHVLKALDMSKERLQSAIRFSFSRYNTITEIEYAISALSEIISELNFITI